MLAFIDDNQKNKKKYYILTKRVGNAHANLKESLKGAHTDEE